MDVLGDVQKEYEKETEKLKKTIAELLDIIVSLKKRNEELDEKRKKALSDYYETAVKLEEAQGLALKLTAQVNHNYENSSMPSSKCIGRKKITNNREKTGRKPGAQAGHPHHPRKPLRPDKVVEIAAEEKFRDGYNLYLRMVEYRHNRLLFLSNPLVEPDNNLCERKARILKGKINQAISLRSFEHLTYFCECLSALDHFATNSEDNLYESVKGFFTRPKPTQPKPEKSKSANTALSECKAG